MFPFDDVIMYIYFRRALKATFVLVPLFGIQLMFIIYRPPASSAGAKEFEIISYLITNLQVIVNIDIATVVFYYNGRPFELYLF